MLIALLESACGSVKRDVEFSRGTFTTEGLGEVGIDDLRRFDSANQLEWVSDDMRELALSYSRESSVSFAGSVCLADAQLQLAVETEVVYVPPHRLGSKTEAELKRIVADMVERGWILVEDSRMGAAGGHLTFQRAEPLGPEILAALSFAG
jgi:hypothetical protein